MGFAIGGWGCAEGGAKDLGKVVIICDTAADSDFTDGKRCFGEKFFRIGKTALFDIFGRGGREVFLENPINLAVSARPLIEVYVFLFFFLSEPVALPSSEGSPTSSRISSAI